jgi:hypothetical protein
MATTTKDKIMQIKTSTIYGKHVLTSTKTDLPIMFQTIQTAHKNAKKYSDMLGMDVKVYVHKQVGNRGYFFLETTQPII